MRIHDSRISFANLLIIPVLAATPMGLKLFKGKSKSSDALSKSNDVLVLSFLTAGFLILQLAVGCGVTLVCKAFGANTFDGMGLEMGAGFAGGHGTAASIGSSFEELGNPNWEAALGGGMTTATVGVIGGILIGTALINYAARHGYTTQIKSAAETPLEMRTGFYEKGMERPSMGPQTTVSNSIETLTLHLGLLLIATFLAYPFSTLCKMTGISLFSSIPTWLYGMIVMLILWSAISFLKLDYLFDDAVKNKVTGLLSDYMITAAIMSISLSVVLTYWVVLVAVIVAGLILVPVLNWFICKILSIMVLKKVTGSQANLGVYVTGMLLIKMADPDLKSDALSDWYAWAALIPGCYSNLGDCDWPCRYRWYGICICLVCALPLIVARGDVYCQHFYKKEKGGIISIRKRIGDCDETSEWIDCDRVSVLL